MAREDRLLVNATQTILVVDDEQALRMPLQEALRDMGYHTLEAASGAEALSLARDQGVDLVILDLRLGRESGLDVLRRLREVSPELPVIMLTAYGTARDAFEAAKLGAVSFLTKPYQLDELKERVRYEFETPERETRSGLALRPPSAGTQLLGESGEILRVLGQIAKIARLSKATVLIHGETGVGKELVARRIHWESPRAAGPFVELNCAAVPENLLESEIFGFEKGAFTDAKRTKKGVFEMAEGGTLFLDEIGEMPMGLQSKLLRVLESKSFRRLGGTSEISVDTRVVAATNRDLKREVESGRFREDLYFRLQVIPLEVPPLRARRGDVLLLIRHFVERFSQELGKAPARVDPEAVSLFTDYAWPGNVRELRNTIERIVLLESEDEIRVDHLPTEILRSGAAADRPTASSEPPSGIGFPDGIVVPLAEVERRAIQHALACERGNKTRAAQALGISRQTLRTKLKEYQIDEGRDGEE